MTPHLHVVGDADAQTDTRAMLFDLEAERSLLGNVLYAAESTLPIVAALLRPDHFSSRVHRFVFEAVLALRDAGKPIEITSVQIALREAGRLAEVQSGYLGELLNLSAVASQRGLRLYAETILDRAIRRCMRETGQRIEARSGADPKSTAEILAEERASLDAIAVELERSREDLFAPSAVVEAMRGFSEASSGRVVVARTGLRDLDSALGGLRAELTVLAGTPGMGKTSLATQIVEAVCAKGLGVYVACLDTPRRDFMQRLLASRAGVSIHRAQRGALKPAEASRLMTTANEVHAWPLAVDEEAGMTGQRLVARARSVHLALARQKKRLGLVVVDYVQRLRGGHANTPREQVVAENVRRLAALSVDLDVPVLGLSQLNREVSKRPDKRPQLSDLRESGEIEAAARVVLLMYRGDYYARAKEPTGEAELEIAKANNGPSGHVVRLAFDAPRLRFHDLEDLDEQLELPTSARRRGRRTEVVTPAAATAPRDDDEPHAFADMVGGESK